MIAEILSTGEEIRSGAVPDTNTAHIAQKLEEVGVEVIRHNCVGDDAPRLVAVLGEIAERADVAVVTGGLGPTDDDLNSLAAARAKGVSLVTDERALDQIEQYFRKLGKRMPLSNKKQALFPKGAKIMYNPVGTAPGFRLEIGKCRFFFLPGVPHEMKRMLADGVLPDILERQGKKRTFFRVRTVRIFGSGESVVNERIQGLHEKFSDVKLGLRARFPEIQVKLQIQGNRKERLDAILKSASDWVVKRMGDSVFSTSGESMQEVVGALLRKKNATLAVAESCTGGLIAHWLTGVAGSSDYFLLSAVTYSNHAKMKLLGVGTETPEKYGAVSENTAREMAHGARVAAGATFGISTTGIAGPSGGSPQKPVGTVCIGIASANECICKRFVFSGLDRSKNKKLFAMSALNLLRRELETDSRSLA